VDAAAADTLDPLVRKLESIAPLSDEERQAIVGLPMMVRNLKADQDIVRDQDRPSQCCLILEGFACRYKVIEGGKRQIFSFHIPGDIPDLQSLHLDIMDHSLGTIVASKVAFIPHEMVRAFIRAHPRIGDVFWRDTLIDAAIFREWMAGLGRREAYARGRRSSLVPLPSRTLRERDAFIEQRSRPDPSLSEWRIARSFPTKGGAL
jgi:CRP-like cAMP-binding protein